MALKKARLFEGYENEVFQLIDGFSFKNQSYEKQSNGKGDYINRGQKKILGIKYTPDFVGKDFNKEQQKKQARIMYNRRKLEKDIKLYIKNDRIKGSEIERIGRQHGFYVKESLFRKNKVSHEDA